METKIRHVTPPSQSGRYVAMLGALLVMVGAFLAWGIADGTAVTGMDGDGKLTFTIALIAFIMLSFKRISLWISIVLGVIIEGIGIMQNITMNARITELKNMFASTLSGQNVTGAVGIGVYLTMIGAALMVFGGLFLWLKNRPERLRRSNS